MRERGSMRRMCVCVCRGVLISYLWICLDTRECFCADFKHYLILQTSLLMLPRSEADCSAACQMKIGALALCAWLWAFKATLETAFRARSDISKWARKKAQAEESVQALKKKKKFYEREKTVLGERKHSTGVLYNHRWHVAFCSCQLSLWLN